MCSQTRLRIGRAVLGTSALAVLLAVIPTPVSAHKSPGNCQGNLVQLSVTKDRDVIDSGDDVIYTISVSNPTNGCDITCATVTFQCPGTNGFPGASQTLLNGVDIPSGSDFVAGIVTCSVTTVTGQNFAQAQANLGGILHDLNTGCESLCVTNNCDPDSAQATKTVSVAVFHPCISITKQAAGTNCEPFQIQYSGIVSNCGDVTLTNVFVADVVGGVTNLLQSGQLLLAGGTLSYSGSYVPTVNPSPDTAIAQGQDSFTLDTLIATASATGTISCAPAILITEQCVNAPALGQPITFSGIVSNTGCVTLTDVTVISGQAGVLTNGITLGPGDGAPYSGQYIPTGCDDTVNQVIAAGVGPDICGSVIASNSIMATCTVGLGPAVGVDKQVNCPTGFDNLTIGVTATVTNLGNTSLSSVSVVDNQAGSLALASGPSVIPVAGSAVYTGSYVAVSFPSADQVGVSAQGPAFCPDGTNITVTALSPQRSCNLVCTPGITVTKQNVCPDAGGLPVPFSGVVSNSGNIVLSNVTVTDDQAGALTNVATLAAGAWFGYSGSYTPLTLPTSNTVTATGTVPGICTGRDPTNISAQASASCNPPPPGDCITRTPGYWFNHLTSSKSHDATLVKAIDANGGRLDLGFMCLPTNGVANATLAMRQALSFFPPSKQGLSPLCAARMQLGFHLIAAIANSALFGTQTDSCNNTNGASLPANLITMAQQIGACDDVQAINAVAALLDQFNNSGDAAAMPAPWRAGGLGGSKNQAKLRINVFNASNCGSTNNCVTGHACP